MCFAHIQFRFNPWHLIWSPKPTKNKSLGTELGVSPENCWVWPKAKKNFKIKAERCDRKGADVSL